MYKVTKEVWFSYGHRLLNYAGKCRHLHGHNGRLEIELAAERLDARGMVRDFDEIKKTVQAWIDEHLDHRMILSKDDPALPVLTQLGEPVYVVEANPTAEHLAKVIFEQIAAQGFPVTEVRLWETATSFATYHR